MRKVNPDDYGGGDQKPKLTPDVLDNAEFAVLTVKESETGIITGDRRTAALLVFEEKPEHAFWLNKTGVTTLVEKLGEDADKWNGQQVPIMRVRNPNPQTGKYVVKYVVAMGEDWDDILEEAKSKKPRRKGGKKGKKK